MTESLSLISDLFTTIIMVQQSQMLALAKMQLGDGTGVSEALGEGVERLQVAAVQSKSLIDDIADRLKEARQALARLKE